MKFQQSRVINNTENEIVNEKEGEDEWKYYKRAFLSGRFDHAINILFLIISKQYAVKF